MALLVSRPGSLFELSFDANVREVEDTLRHGERWMVPYAASTALSRTAFEAAQAEGKKIEGVFDRPTSFTRKAVLYRKASADNLTYRIFLRDEASRGGTPPAVYLRPQVKGGPRRPKPFELALRRKGVMEPDEFAIPAIGMKRNAFGNLPASVIGKILSQLGARRDPLQNTTARSRKRSKARGGAVYFVPDENNRRGLPRGVYERMAGRKIRLVLLFVSGMPRYRKRYDFGQAAKAKALRVFGPHFAQAFNQLKSRW
jgi:hypothetical protein